MWHLNLTPLLSIAAMGGASREFSFIFWYGNPFHFPDKSMFNIYTQSFQTDFLVDLGNCKFFPCIASHWKRNTQRRRYMAFCINTFPCILSHIITFMKMILTKKVILVCHEHWSLKINGALIRITFFVSIIYPSISPPLRGGTFAKEAPEHASTFFVLR